MRSEAELDIAALIDGADPIPDQAVELSLEGLTQREALLRICDEAVVWRSFDGEPFASVPVGNHTEHHPVLSRAFRNWLLYRLASRYRHNGRPASANENAIREARAAVEAQAMVAGPVQKAPLRVAESNDAIYLDLGAQDWSAIRIDKGGWRAVSQTPIPIIRGKRTAQFASPASAPDFRPIRKLLSHLDDETFILLIAWCVGALLPDGPYPILVLGGEQGAGKSTLARLAQRIADPVNGDLLQPPRDDRDLIACARTNRVLSFDNLSGLSSELADSLCRLATGSEIGGRALFSDYDLATFSACRPIVVNGIPDLAARADLADRSIVLRLPQLPGRATERELRAAVDEVMPECFAALLDALSCGLRRLDATPTPDVRMADFARFVVAAEPALPWAPGAFLAAMQRARQHANITLAEGDVVAAAVRDFIDLHGRVWVGLTSELHKTLTSRVSAVGRSPQDWPGNARWFGERLRRAAPALRSLGIGIEEKRQSNGTVITLYPTSRPAASAPFAPEFPATPDGANGASVDSWPPEPS
jgi:putative DNA primase/helicase